MGRTPRQMVNEVIRHAVFAVGRAEFRVMSMDETRRVAENNGKK